MTGDGRSSWVQIREGRNQKGVLRVRGGPKLSLCISLYQIYIFHNDSTSLIQ